jgi:hypothetical protein
MMWLLFQKCSKTKSFIERRFNSAMELKAPDPSGERGRKVPLLPWPSGPEYREMGFPQSVKELLDLGAAQAALAGVANPSTSQRIHYAFAAVASLGGGCTLSDTQVRERIQYALFDLPDRPVELSQQLEEEVELRLGEVLWTHIESDEPQDRFNQWFWGGSNSFVKQVAQGLPGRALDEAHQLVWYVLLQLGFRSYEYLGHCIQAVMRDIANCLDPPLTVEEELDFGKLYYPQPAFGGLPLILLAEKLEFCEGLVNRLLTNPEDAAAHAELHQLLFYYGDLVRLRREADRKKKARPGSSQMPLSLE